MPGKISCKRDEVVYRASLDGLGGNDQIGNVDEYGLHHSFVQDFYGKHYIVTENSVGFVDVEAFDTTFVDSDGALKRSAAAGNRWLELSDAYDDWCIRLNEEGDDVF